jgi:hypothetical protein
MCVFLVLSMSYVVQYEMEDNRHTLFSIKFNPGITTGIF